MVTSPLPSVKNKTEENVRQQGLIRNACLLYWAAIVETRDGGQCNAQVMSQIDIMTVLHLCGESYYWQWH